MEWDRAELEPGPDLGLEVLYAVVPAAAELDGADERPMTVGRALGLLEHVLGATVIDD